MVNKSDIDAQLKGIVSDRFITLWWDLRIPGLGMDTPAEVFSKDPDRLMDYAKSYRDSSFT